MVRRVSLCVMNVLVILITTLVSVLADDAADCQGGQNEKQIKGCSSIIISGRLFGKPVSKQGLVVAYNNRASAYAAKGDFTRAIADYSKAIDLDPKFAQAYFNRGIAFGNKNRADKAIADYDRAINLDSKFADAYNNRGLAYHFKGDFDHAIDDYEKAIRINPKYATAYNNRGDAYEKKGDLKKASADYRKALSLDPSHKAARYNLKQLKMNAAKKKPEAPKVSRVDIKTKKQKPVKKEPYAPGQKTFSLRIDSLQKASWKRLGVRVSSLTKPMTKALGLSELTGALVTSVTPSSPAHKSGIHPGDVILALSGQEIADQRYPTKNLIATTSDQPLDVTVWRAAQTINQLVDRIQREAESGNASAMILLAHIHSRGVGKKKNKVLAFTWTKKAAEAGEPHAMSELGAKYAYGQGIPKDDTTALGWYKKAASKGNARAMNSLGFIYSVGRGVSKDLRQAADWFTKAAVKGHLSANYNLARAYANGKGVKRSDKTAVQYMLRSLQGGHYIAIKQMSGKAKSWSIPFRQELQRQLKTKGLYTGIINGKFSPGTSRAIQSLVNSSPTKLKKKSTSKPVGKIMFVLYPELHVFPEPSLKATRTGSLFRNDKVVVKQWHENKSGKWAKVCARKKDLCGWVGADFLENTPLQ